jgi:hypothetical protein
MLFREIIAVYSEKHMQLIVYIDCGQNAEILIVKADGIYSYHYALNG